MHNGRIVSLNNADYGFIERFGKAPIRFNQEDNTSLTWTIEALLNQPVTFNIKKTIPGMDLAVGVALQ